MRSIYASHTGTYQQTDKRPRSMACSRQGCEGQRNREEDENRMLYHVYVGTYMGEGKGEGIYLLELDTEKKTLEKKKSYPEVSDNPSFLALRNGYLYAVSERDDGGGITSFSIDEKTGELTFLNKIRTEGTSMCHLTVWPDGKHISAANYSSGSLLVCEIGGDGHAGSLCEFVQHEGRGVNPLRQEGPHVHSTVVSGDGRYLYAADLGLDQIFCYEIRENGKLFPAGEERQIEFPPGEGPRHFVFTKDEKWLYALTELGGRVFAFRAREKEKIYDKVYDVSALPEDFQGENLAADIHLSGDERFLYVSNRGMDCITVFHISGEGIPDRTVEYHTSYGKEPRNFCITPDGGFVLIADQAGGRVVLCPRDPDTGRLGEKLAEVEIPQAVFVAVD